MLEYVIADRFILKIAKSLQTRTQERKDANGPVDGFSNSKEILESREMS